MFLKISGYVTMQEFVTVQVNDNIIPKVTKTLLFKSRCCYKVTFYGREIQLVSDKNKNETENFYAISGT